MREYVTGHDMKCPVCDAGLIPKDEAHYETLVEHVGNPNGIPSMKTGWGCTNPECDIAKSGVRWLEDGEGPYRSNVPARYWPEGNPHPRGTYYYESRYTEG